MLGLQVVPKLVAGVAANVRSRVYGRHQGGGWGQQQQRQNASQRLPWALRGTASPYCGTELPDYCPTERLAAADATADSTAGGADALALVLALACTCTCTCTIALRWGATSAQ